MSGPAALERTLAQRIRERSTGILTVTEGKVRRLFCLRKGALIHAASNIIEEQFEEYLVREQRISPADRADAKLSASKEDTTTLEWLVSNERIARADLEQAIGDHAMELLAAALVPAEAEAVFVKGQVDLEGKPVTELPLDRFLLDFLAEHPKSPHEVRVRLGQPGLLPVRITEREEATLALTESHPLVAEIWKMSDGDLSVSALTQNVSAGEEAGLRTLYALMLLGAVEALTHDARAAQSPERVPVTRNELLARLERAESADHYGVLELGSKADSEAIRQSYYMLAQRYHPDRFRSGEHTEMLPRIESFFAQVTEAYNTLSEAESRRAYDAELARDDASKRDSEPVHDSSHLARQNYLRAKVLAQRNQYQQAVTFLENAIELDENVPEFHVELGTVLVRNPRRRDDAEEHLRRGIELDPTVAAGHVALADLLVKRDRKEEALRVVEEGLKWAPSNPDLARLAEELGAGKGRGLFGR